MTLNGITYVVCVGLVTGLATIGAGCSSRSTLPEEGAGGTWVKREREVGGCLFVEEFSVPRLEGRICRSDVVALTGCQGMGASSLYIPREYFAIPDGVDGCASLEIGRDFFPHAEYVGSEYYLDILRHAAILLRKEMEGAGLSEELLGIGRGAAIELVSRQMSALSELRVEPWVAGENERFRLVFALPDSGRAIALFIDEDGGDPEWAVILE